MKNNFDYFSQLIDIIENSKHPLAIINSEKYENLKLWIHEALPLLSKSQFTLQTKIYWILNGIVDFPKCATCNSPILRNVNTLKSPKYKYCSSECAHKSPEMPKLVRETKKRKYGNLKQTIGKKISQSLKNRSTSEKKRTNQLRRSTYFKRTGYYNPANNPTSVAKRTATRRNKNNGNYESDTTKQKKKNTFFLHYGVDNNMKSKKGLASYQKVIQKKYNDDSITSPMQVKSVVQKSKNTFQAHMKDDSFRLTRQERLKKSSDNRFGKGNYMNRKKAKQTMIENYGVPYPMQSKEIVDAFDFKTVHLKSFETKLKNGTFNSSKPEEEAYMILCQKFGKQDVLRQYKSEKYPFACDFYIKSKDLYIECNFNWTHGGHWFDINNKEDLAQLQKWKDKDTKFYMVAVDVWTRRDALKHQTAIQNNLNYLVFWKISELQKFLEI